MEVYHIVKSKIIWIIIVTNNVLDLTALKKKMTLQYVKDLLRENLAVVFGSAPGCYLMLSGAFYWQNNMKTIGRPREHVRDVIW